MFKTDPVDPISAVDRVYPSPFVALYDTETERVVFIPSIFRFSDHVSIGLLRSSGANGRRGSARYLVTPYDPLQQYCAVGKKNPKLSTYRPRF